ncbi:MAG: DUF1345 domain-containing protein [Acetobacteraceae bacterium]|nr:DUF1345 domain-containing protein [Acetobacteraceae bacterium]
MPVFAWLWRVVTLRPRLFFSFLFGLAAYLLVPAGDMAKARAVLSWDAGVTVYLIAAGVMFFDEREDRMARDAERLQEGEWTVFFVTVAAIVMSFIALIAEFTSTQNVPASQRGVHVAVVAFTLFASWLMTHVTFGLRYAHEYYSRNGTGEEYERGLDFPAEKKPDYLDFMYFSLVIGMTFQVSDVQITSRKLRRLAALQGLLSFLFNTVIVALTVNIAAGLL